MKMRTGICFLIFLLVQLTSCQERLVAPVERIAGHWQWVFSFKSQPYELSQRLTPENTGVQETIVYNADYTWLKIQNNVNIDSGTYTTGHGSFKAIGDSYTFHYDSIVYYRDGLQVRGMEEYYSIIGDTLVFGRFLHDQYDDPNRSWKCYTRK